MPKFQDMLTWQQADLLMQPAFIRLIDNFRKKLDESVWTGKYEDIEVWPEGTSDATKFRVKQLQAELESLPLNKQRRLRRHCPGCHLLTLATSFLWSTRDVI